MHTLDNGLISYWPLWEASGTRYDVTGQGNNLTDVNTVTGNPGRVVLASQFTAVNSERLTLVSNASIQTGDIDFTWACWVYLDSKAAFREIISKYGAAANREYVLNYNSAGDRFEFNVYTAGGTPVTVVNNALGSPALSTWYFLAGWHDASANTANIEANAALGNSGATGAALQAAGTATLAIGAEATPGYYWNGRICEVGFWKRVLTQAERVWLYNNGQGRTYPFDDRPALPHLDRRFAPRGSRDTGGIG